MHASSHCTGISTYPQHEQGYGGGPRLWERFWRLRTTRMGNYPMLFAFRVCTLNETCALRCANAIASGSLMREIHSCSCEWSRRGSERGGTPRTLALVKSVSSPSVRADSSLYIKIYLVQIMWSKAVRPRKPRWSRRNREQCKDQRGLYSEMAKLCGVDAA